ncbi:MAG: zinc-binding dehydrogenase, partial [Cyclobacteriaceae bacterium]|nr:zinc-binding dehydrogenase [Cyclobacteriaceae bacterium]
PEKSFQNIAQLMQWVQDGKIQQHIGERFSLENSPKALRDILDRKMLGKGVVIVKP